MASTVTSFSNVIKINYPIAGRDNNSQGFRDNFQAIQLAFDATAREISQIQSVASKLTSEQVDFAFANTIVRSISQNYAFTAVNSANRTPNLANIVEIDYSLGSYQKSSITNNTNFSVINWPRPGLYASMRLEVVSTIGTTINFSAGAGIIRPDRELTLPFVAQVSGSSIWELWSSDGGATVFVKLLIGDKKEFQTVYGSNRQIIFNSGGVNTGSNNLTFDGNSVVLSGELFANNISSGGARVVTTATISTSVGGTSTQVLFKSPQNISTGSSNLTFDGLNLSVGGDVSSKSDARIKTNVETITDAVNLIKQLRGVKYQRTDTGEDSIGVIAQEVQMVIPEVVKSNSEGYLSVAYGNIVGLLIEAVKELSNELEQIKNSKNV